MEELAILPFDSWIAFYQAAQAQRLEEMAAQVTIQHTANAKRMRKKLLDTARKVRFPKKPLVADPRRLKAMLTGMPGVAIKEGKDK